MKKIEDHPMLIKLCFECENTDCNGSCTEYKTLHRRLSGVTSEEEAQQALEDVQKRMERQKAVNEARNGPQTISQKHIGINTFRRVNRAIEALQALCDDADASVFLMGTAGQKLLVHMQKARMHSCGHFIDWAAVENAMSAGGGEK